MSALIAPNPPAVPPHPRPTVWTVTAFRRAREAGTWENRRAILLNGVVWELGPMKTPHAVAVDLVNDVLRDVFGAGWRVRVQLPIECVGVNDPFPDFAVIRGAARDFLASHPSAAATALVVEVADTSLDIDTTEKAELYAASGVSDYWLLDLEGRRLLVFRDPAPVAAGGHSYRTRLLLGPADAVAPLAAPTAAVRVADLLP